MTFHVGQKVVCVDDEPSKLAGQKVYSHAARGVRNIVRNLSGLKKDAVYTVSGFGINHTGSQGIHLAEIKRPNNIPYRIERFRPVVEHKTDIAIFQAMLNPSDERVSA